MKRTISGIMAIILTFTMIFTLTSCKGSKGDTTTAALTDTSTQAGATETGATTAASDVSTTAGNPSLTIGSTVTGTTGKNGTAPTKKNETAPSTVAQIISYFNTAANKVKPNSKSIIQNYEKNSPVGGVEVGSNKTLSKWATQLMNDNMGYVDAKAKQTSTTAAQKNANFPVADQSWSSKLTPSMVSSAKCTESNGVYTITIVVKEDTTANPSAGTGYTGQAFSVVTKKSIVDNEGGAKIFINNDSIKIQHHASTIVAKIDTATGHMIHANYNMPLTLSLRALGVNASVGFSVEKDFTINW